MRLSRTVRWWTLTVGTLVGGLLLVSTGTASAATTISVTNTSQLAAAINTANATSGATTIDLAPGNYNPGATQTFTNTSGTITLQGSTTGQTHIVGTSVTLPTFPSDLFDVSAGASVTFSNLLITGSASGVSAINNSGTIDVESSAITGNPGVAVTIQTGATGTIRNSTIGGNSDFGIVDTGTLSLFNATVAGNIGGIDNASGVLNLTNSIVANNGGAGNCTASAATADHSLDSDGTCGVGTLSNQNPKLGNLIVNGGFTPTFPLLPGSPAIDAGNPTTCTSTDQQGNPRPDVTGTNCDVGADEYNTVLPTISVPTDITTPATDASGAHVSYTASAMSQVANVTSFQCTPASGSLFAIGMTTVQCTATDGHQNVATASFHVTITSPSLTAQAITFTSTVPASPVVGGSYTPAATGGGSGNPVVFSVDSSSAAGACSISAGGVVSFDGPGSCVIDANQAGNATFSAAPQVQQTLTITSPSNSVADQIRALLASVESSNLPAPLRNFLASLLTAALADLGGTAGGPTAGPLLTASDSHGSSHSAHDRHGTRAACRDLELFALTVELARRQIPDSLRDQWLQSVRTIETSLGCGCGGFSGHGDHGLHGDHGRGGGFDDSVVKRGQDHSSGPGRGE
jgi:hypothetical protein